MVSSVISLFSGAGGLDRGFRDSGYKIKVMLDIDKAAIGYAEDSDMKVIQSDIRKIKKESIVSALDESQGIFHNILIGGPPCQPFSKAGQWVNGSAPSLSDPRGNLVAEMLRIAEGLLPKVILIENVPGLQTAADGAGEALICKLIDQINRRHGTAYKPNAKVLDAASYGVPQHRKRLFIVASRDGREFQFPRPTHGEQSSTRLDVDGSLSPYITAWDVIGHLEEDHAPELAVNGKWGDLLPSIPEGKNYQWHTRKGGGENLFGYRTRYWAFLLKLAKNRPSWTLSANPGTATGPFHWNNRRLSVREMAALQTFPPDIRFAGTYRDAQRQIGNAVPPLLAEVLARAIGEQFFGMSYDHPPKLAIEKASSIPPPEPVQPVPDKYLHLVGNHPDHPGEGKGPGAMARSGSA